MQIQVARFNKYDEVFFKNGLVRMDHKNVLDRYQRSLKNLEFDNEIEVDVVINRNHNISKSEVITFLTHVFSKCINFEEVENYKFNITIGDSCHLNIGGNKNE